MILRLIFTTNVLAFLLLSSSAQIPDLRCIAVDPNGDVTLTWVNNNDSINIYRNQTGQYNLIDSILIPSISDYLDITANLSNNPKYFIQSRTDTSLRSDTLNIIDINVSNTVPGIASISWNHNHIPLLSTSSLWYYIYREFPVGTWQFIDSTQLINYNDTIDMCYNSTISYKVEIKDATGCQSVSTIEGAIFSDITPPAVPVIDSVSVDDNNNVIISWGVSSNMDTEGYIIYIHTGGSFSTPIDTVWGISTASYIDSNSSSGTLSQTYQIAAFDSCNNTSTPSSPQHNTILLQYDLDRCAKITDLNWNSYKGWAVSNYDVYLNKNASSYTVIGSVSSIDSLIYSSTGINNGDSLCYFIRAYNSNNTKTSSSNRVCFLADIINPPDSTYLKVSTVQNNNEIYLEWLVDLSADVMKYKILRGNSPFSNFDTIAILSAQFTSQMNYTDKLASPDEKSYYYRLLVVDSCGVNAFFSNVGRTIYLSASPKMDLTNVLEWNTYEGWLGGVNSYNLYRSVDGGASQLLATLPFSQNNYIDDVSAFLETYGKFCYYVEAIEDEFGNYYNMSDTSFSNTACAIQIPRLYIPNAFRPGSRFNPVFKPVNVFADPGNYLFQIFDRWGKLLFETTNQDNGWDGYYKNVLLPFGVYVYYVRFTGTNGQLVGEKGTVTLLR